MSTKRLLLTLALGIMLTLPALAIEVTGDGSSAALARSNWKTHATFDEMLTDKPGPESWPITAGTFIVIPIVATNPEKTIAALKFFSWSFLCGDDIARKVGSVRLTDSLQAKIYGMLMTITEQSGKPLQWSIHDLN
jgi:phosphate transport system substrate-binding protein